MKQIKKFLGMFLVLAMVIGTIGMMPAMQTKAADGDLTFNAANNTVVIEKSGTTAVYLYVGEVKNDEVKSYSVYEVAPVSNKITLDVSAYAKKGVTLRIHFGTESAAKTIEIEKSDIKLKVKLALDESTIADRFNITNGTVAADTSNIMFRAESVATWTKFTSTTTGATLADTINQIEALGATLYFKDAGKDGTSAAAGKFASAEVKVKYPKMGKAPSITVDYTKGIVKFPKGIQVKGIDGTANNVAIPATAAWAEFTPTKDKAESISMDKLVPTPAANATVAKIDFYARTAATEKKPASALTAVTIVAQEAVLTITTKATEATTKDVFLKRVTKSSTNNTLKGIELKNNTEKDIEYTVVDTTTTTIPATAKWTKVAAKGSKVLPAETAGKAVVVRVAGVNENVKKEIAAVRSSANTALDTKVDGSKVSLPVTWTNSGNTFTGALGTLPAGVTNSTNKTVANTGITVTITP